MKHSSINCNIHDDPEFRKMPLEARYLYFALISHPNIHLTGIYRVSISALALMTQLPEEQVSNSLSLLEAKGWVKYDQQTESVLILRYFVEQLSNHTVSKLTKPTDKRFTSLIRYYEENSNIPFWPDFVHQHKEALKKVLGNLPESLKASCRVHEPRTKPESGTCADSGKPAAAPAAAPAALEAPPAQPASACLPVNEVCIIDKTPDARLALAAAPDGPLAQAAAPVGKGSQKADDCVVNEDYLNDPRNEVLAKCKEEYAARYDTRRFWESRVLLAGYELNKVCNQPGYFGYSSQDAIARRYKLPIDLIREYGLVIYVFKVLKALSEPASIWVRDLYGHIIKLLWEEDVDHTEENIRRIKAMRTAANRQLPAFAELPEVILEEAEVTPAQVTAVEPQEEEIQTPCRNRLEFLEHLSLQELESTFKANISVGLHDDCWKQDFKTEECQDELARRFGPSRELMNKLAGAIVLTEKGYPWIETSIGRCELLKEKEPDRLAKAENRKLAEAFLLSVRPGQIPMEQDLGSIPEQADELPAEEDYEPDF